MLSTNDLSTGYASVGTSAVSQQRKGSMAIRRVTFVSTDAITNDGTNFKFTMPQPLNNVVYADWSIAHNLPFSAYLQIQEIPSRGITSAQQPYLAILPTGTVQQNVSISQQPPVLNQPVYLNTVTLALNPVTSSGSATTWAIEIWFYVTE
jgi:hypothetical protein